MYQKQGRAFKTLALSRGIPSSFGAPRQGSNCLTKPLERIYTQLGVFSVRILNKMTRIRCFLVFSEMPLFGPIPGRSSSLWSKSRPVASGRALDAINRSARIQVELNLEAFGWSVHPLTSYDPSRPPD